MAKGAMTPAKLDELSKSIRDDIKRRFLALCLVEQMHPEDAAQELGISYALLLAHRRKDEVLAAAWIGADKKEVGQASKSDPMDTITTSQIDALELKDRVRKKIFIDGRLADKILNMISRIEPNDRGDQKLIALLRAGVMKTLLPQEVAQKIQQVPHLEALLEKPPEELEALADEWAARRQIAVDKRKEARLKQEALLEDVIGGKTVTEADFEVANG